MVTVPQCASPTGVTGYVTSALLGTAATAAGQSPSGPGVRQTEVTGLTAGSLYRVRSAASNADGPGPSSGLSLFATPPFTSLAAFTDRQHRDFAGRPPTATETADWNARLAAGSLTPVAAIDGLQAGPHWQRQSPVTRLFQAYFLRLPDKAGLDYWTGRYRAGTTLDTISQGFAGSNEFRTRYGALSNRQFVELVYQNVLGRPGDASGVTYWTGQLDQGRKNRGQVMTGFSESAEYKRKAAGAVDTVNLFTGMLLRVPTTAEVATWGPQGRTPTISFLLATTAYEARTRVVAPPAITTTSLPNGTRGVAYAGSVTAAWGDGARTFAISEGALPAGVALASTGALTGTPSAAGAASFTVRVSDSKGRSDARAFTVSIGQIAITTTSLPGATQYSPYSTTLAAAGGAAPVTWSTSSPLPTGITLSPAGVLAGTTTQTGTFPLTITARDANAVTATKTLSLAVAVTTGPVITTSDLPAGQQGVAYAASVSAAGGSKPYAWAISAGSLPTGLSLDPTYGLITGTPTGTGTATFTVRVTAQGGATSTKQLTVAVGTIQDWPQANRDATGRAWAPEQTTINPTNIGGLGREWTIPARLGGLAAAGGLLYAIGPLPGQTSGAHLIVLRPADGSVVSSRDLAAEDCGAGYGTGSVAVAGDKILTICSNGVRAYSRTAPHSILWDTKTDDPGTANSQLVVAGSTVMAWSPGFVTAYRLSDGARLWQQLPTAGSISSVSVSGTTAVVSSYLSTDSTKDRLRAFNLTTGALLWTVNRSAGTTISGDWVYTGDARVSLATGALGWESGQRGPILAVDGDSYYQRAAQYSGGEFAGFSLQARRLVDGTLRWEGGLNEWPFSGAVTGSIFWVNGGLSSEYLTGYRTSDGAQVFEENRSGRAAGGATWAYGRVFVPHGSGLTAYGLAPSIPAITTKVLPAARTGVAHPVTLEATGGLAPYSWTVTAGALPAGLALSPSGTLTGTPTAIGAPRITFRVTDSRGRSSTRVLTVQVNGSGQSVWRTSGQSSSRNGVATLETTIGVPSAAQLSARWRTAPLTGTAYPDNRREPVVIADRLYDVGTDGRLHAYSTTGTGADRAPIWSADAVSGRTFISGVTEHSGTLLVLDDSQHLYGIRASDGVRLWRYETNTLVGLQAANTSAPVVVGSVAIIVDAYTHKAHGVSVTTGAAAWTAPVDIGSASWWRAAGDATRAYVVRGCRLTAITASTGTVAWWSYIGSYETDNCNGYLNTTARPVVHDGVVYASTANHTAAFTASTGARRWRVSLPGAFGLTVSHGLLFVPAVYVDSPMHALDIETGATVYTVAQTFQSPVSVAGDLGLFRSYGKVRGFDITTGGLILDAGDTGDAYTYGGVAIAGGRIYASTNEAGIRTFGPP